jgi:membrane protein required for beta-lactamase induction
MLYAFVIGIIALAVIAFWIASWWGGVIVLVLGVLAAMYIAGARSQDRSVGAVETGARREPTGRPRSGSAGAETANERVES